MTCWAPTSLLGQEILQDTTSAIKSGRHRLSAEYSLTNQIDDGDATIALQDRSRSHLGDGDTSISIFVTPEASLRHDASGGSTSDLSRAVTSDGSPTKKTLQIRHSDSFDGSSYAGSSEDTGDEDEPKERKHHIKRASVSFANSMATRRNDALNEGQRDIQDEADFLSTGTTEGATRTADQAGAILGIANV